MTDLLEPYVDTTVDDLPPLDVTDEPRTDSSVPAPFLAYLLAACLTGAGIIHLAMVPEPHGRVAARGLGVPRLGRAPARPRRRPRAAPPPLDGGRRPR